MTNKKKLTILTAATLSIIAAGIGLFAYNFSAYETHQLTQIATIKNLLPEQAIEYTIKLNNGDIVIESAQADQTGKLNLYTSQEKDLQNLDIRVPGENKDVKLNIQFDDQNQGIKIFGSGVNTFSDIELGSEQKTTAIKSNWSGEFEYTLPKTKSDTQKIALYGNQLSDENLNTNPLVIEIMQTQGGGTQTSNRVNWMQHERCKTGSGLLPLNKPDLSTCYDSIDDHAQAITNRYPMALKDMSTQFSAVMMQYVQIIGEILDAKMQLQTQAQIQKMNAVANKDYQPSEQMCRFGSFTKSLAKTEESAKYNKLAINKLLMDRYTLSDRLGQPLHETATDMDSRLKLFRETHCNPRDFNNGLTAMCQHDPVNPIIRMNEDVGASDGNRFNNDIDYTRVIDNPLTIELNLTNSSKGPWEEDVIALAKNLYWPTTLNRINPEQLESEFSDYLDLRHVMAVYNVAHNSFASIVGMKAYSNPLGADSGMAFMKSMMREFGLTDDEINKTMGQNMSYYAQMEVLTKKMFQHPNFYTNLYDKPANLKRINATMEAIKLMQMRDWFNTNLRKEMLTSLLLETQLEPSITAVSERIGGLQGNK